LFPSWDGRNIGYKLTGYTYQKSDQKKSTKHMTVDKGKKNESNISGNWRIAQ
jgi:hypothetical protein